VVVDRDVRITLVDLPVEFHRYPGWRVGVKCDILNALPQENEAGMLFMEELDDPSVTFEDLADPLPEPLRILNSRLYSAVMKACQKHSDNYQYVLSLQTEVAFGQGRQAIRILDKAHNYEAPLLAIKAGGYVSNHKCGSMQDLSEHVAQLRLCLLQMGKISQQVEVLIVPQILKNIEGIQNTGLSATIAEFENQDLMDQRSRDLIDRLEKAAIKFKAKQEENKKKVPANAAGVDKKCGYCGKANHEEPQCYQKQRDKGGKGGKKGDKGKKGDQGGKR